MYRIIGAGSERSKYMVPRGKQIGKKDVRHLVSKYQALPLPRLPIPELAHTMDVWKQSIRPLVTPEAFQRSVENADDFSKPGGVGEELQRRLFERDTQLQHTSWMSDWWREQAYYRTRDSLPLNSNFFYAFEAMGRVPLDQMTRAAFLTRELMKVRYQMIRETFPQAYMKGVPLCMSAYLKLYNTCRIPGVGQDMAYYPADGQLKGSRHIVVLRLGLFFSLVVCDETGKPYPISTIKKGLERACIDAERYRGTQPQIGLFTTEKRDVWANIRSAFKERDGNEVNLSKVETAAFCVCIDDVPPHSFDDACQIFFHGKKSDVCSANRFFDKSISIIVLADGTAGLSGEHSNIDGAPVTAVTDLILEREKEKRAELLDPLKLGEDKYVVFPARDPYPKLLRWTLDTPVLQKALELARVHFDDEIDHMESTLLEYLRYGQSFIKQVNLSPDGYLQMAFHLTYYRLHNKFTAVYESISVQKYLHGRTEVSRTLSKEAINFVLAFIQSNRSTPSSSHNTYALLKIACSAHIRYNLLASNGRGCDRHILGLKLIAKQGNTQHPFLEDPSHAIGTHWRLSTSQLASQYSVTGYGPVVLDGYGLYYNLRPNKLNFYISSFKNEHSISARKFKEALRTSLDEMHELCTHVFNTKPKL